MKTVLEEQEVVAVAPAARQSVPHDRQRRNEPNEKRPPSIGPAAPDVDGYESCLELAALFLARG